MVSTSMVPLLEKVRACKVCEPHLPLGAKPILAASSKSRILLIGQAPGRKVHETGIAWNDPSGDNLRNWLGIDKEQFYNPDLVAIVPMGFCYPGSGKSGDLPPRPECAPLWHARLLEKMPDVVLTVLIGRYAQGYYLKDRAYKTLTETVRHYKEYLPQYLPLPHPSPRNRIWQRRNPWFEEEILPELKHRVQRALK
ncbi:IclR family transcriptional regulator [Advenella faeciporci]|uniref:IclR family transcriptional regulator n=1 Tax=Advenella faeciporci TaxID=797535 RepID=A0A918MXN0_9BURK|nr:uracil-DNA glycosylase family protein [Advenella faeciporci]GGW84771.1 IclR family transcriptional regulator [Advenella faeciporci]